jgi:outer membrane protein assembly factor BamB
MAEKDFLKAFTYDLQARRVSEQARMTARRRPPDGMPGGFSSLSADGDANGILWTSLPIADAQWTNRAGILAAFDATTLAELWSDPPMDGNTQPAPSPTRGPDDVLFAKFTPPTIADGRVYRATYSNQLIVYGLRPPK